MLPIHTDLWPLFYTGRMHACVLVGTHVIQLGDTHAIDHAFKSGIDVLSPTALKYRQEAIVVTRVAFTTVADVLPEDPPLCGFLNQAAFERELERQKPDLVPDDVVTIVYFQRRMADRHEAA